MNTSGVPYRAFHQQGYNMTATQLEPPPTLKLWSETEAPAQPEEDKGRMSHPALLCTLRDLLSRMKADWPSSRKPSTWSGYDTLLRAWESYFGATKIVDSSLTSGELQAFFESVESWATKRTWEKSLVLLTSILKSGCRQSRINQDGWPEKNGDAPLKLEELPYVAIQTSEWFKANREPGKFRKGGHTPKRRSTTLTLDQFQKVIDACWQCPEIKDPVWWETMFGWIWFSSMRISQARLELPWSTNPEAQGIDVESATILTTDSKCGGLIDVPLPNCLMPGLRSLYHRPKPQKLRPFVFRQWGIQGEDTFYALWNAIWEHAIPCESDAQRMTLHFNPHQLRRVSTTNWDLRPSPDDKLGWMVTGHIPADVRTSVYFAPGDERPREIVNRFPMPRFHATAPLF